MAFTCFFNFNSTAQCGGDPCPNPDLVIGPCENFDVILVLDESGSIDDGTNGQTNENLVRLATLGLAESLQLGGGSLAIVEFSTSSSITDVDGIGPGVAGYRTVDANYVQELDDYLFPDSGPSGYEANGYTNWEAAFNDVIALNLVQTADLVIFMTDGNPTAYVDGGGVDQICGTGSTCVNFCRDAAFNGSNAIKDAGSHIFGLAIGSGISLSNISAMTGPEQDLVPGNIDGFLPTTADYANIPFSELEACFADIVYQSCNIA